jgi:photosystem II stability/assembly factor-like uncharacterized protein
MKNTMSPAWHLLAVAGFMATFSQAIPANLRPAGFQWLGNLPSDDLYSTKAMRVSGYRGVIVKEHSTLISNDGGRSWTRLNNTGPSEDISSAWLTPSLQLLRLSDDSLLVSDTPVAAVEAIPFKEEDVSYLATAATEGLHQMFLVGGRSVATTAQQLETLPQYAHDPTTASPRMIVPAVSVSSDDGKTWQTVGMEKAVGYLDSVKVVDEDVIAWGPYAVYVSTDTGKSWKLMKLDIPDGEEDAYPISGAIVAYRVYISLKNGMLLSGRIDGRSLKSLTRSPSAIGQLIFTSSCVGFGISPSTTKDEDVLMETENGGEAWTPVLRANRIVALTASGSEVYGATDNRAFRLHSDDNLPSGHCAAAAE